MSWQGWDRKVASPRREPTPEPAPPAFHKPRAKRPKKPWAVQIRGIEGLARKFFPDWATLRRYRSEPDAEKARAAYERGESGRWSKSGYLPRHAEYRILAPPVTPAPPARPTEGGEGPPTEPRAD